MFRDRWPTVRVWGWGRAVSAGKVRQRRVLRLGSSGQTLTEQGRWLTLRGERLTLGVVESGLCPNS